MRGEKEEEAVKNGGRREEAEKRERIPNKDVENLCKLPFFFSPRLSSASNACMASVSPMKGGGDGINCDENSEVSASESERVGFLLVSTVPT